MHSDPLVYPAAGHVHYMCDRVALAVERDKRTLRAIVEDSPLLTRLAKRALLSRVFPTAQEAHILRESQHAQHPCDTASADCPCLNPLADTHDCLPTTRCSIAVRFVILWLGGTPADHRDASRTQLVSVRAGGAHSFCFLYPAGDTRAFLLQSWEGQFDLFDWTTVSKAAFKLEYTHDEAQQLLRDLRYHGMDREQTAATFGVSALLKKGIEYSWFNCDHALPPV